MIFFDIIHKKFYISIVLKFIQKMLIIRIDFLRFLFTMTLALVRVKLSFI